MYKAIGFDYGGVIANFSSNFVERVSAAIHVSPEEFRKVFHAHNRRVNVEGMPFEKLLEIILKELGKLDKLSVALEINEDSKDFSLNKPLLKCVETLRKKGFKTGLLSNASHEMAERMREDGLGEYFDVLQVSAEVGVMKPDREAFMIFCEALGVTPQELIFIDDSERSLETAKEVGFTDILYKNYEDLRKKLKELSVL